MLDEQTVFGIAGQIIINDVPFDITRDSNPIAVVSIGFIANDITYQISIDENPIASISTERIV